MLCSSARSLIGPQPSVQIKTLSYRYASTGNIFPVIRSSRRNLSFAKVRMSTSAAASGEVIEHIVLFNVKESTEPSKIDVMVNGLSGLKSLPMVLHLTTGPVLRNRSSALKFTHMLHSRYRTKEDLGNYSAHQDHLSVVRESVLPICEDIMAVDWVAQNLEGPIALPVGSAMRVQFVKLKEELGEKEKGEVFGVIGGMKEKLGSVNQVTLGENFSPARAKGYSIASIGVFSGVNELDAVDGNEEVAKEKEKVRDYIDGLVVLDYVVPAAKSASSM